MGHGTRIPQSAIDFVKENCRTMTHKALAEHIGRDVMSVRWIINKCGLGRPVRRYSKELREKALTLYRDRTASEVAALIGVPKYQIRYWIERYGGRHDEETNKKIRRRLNANLRTPEVREKHDEAVRHVIKMERWRVVSGMPQKTKRKISILPTKIRRSFAHACRRYNYFRDDDCNALVLYYDEETTRNAQYEAFCEKKYNIRFVSAMDDTKEE